MFATSHLTIMCHLICCGGYKCYWHQGVALLYQVTEEDVEAHGTHFAKMGVAMSPQAMAQMGHG